MVTVLECHSVDILVNFVDFNGGSSVTVGAVNAVDPGLKQTGDLYYAKASDTAGTLKINNGFGLG